MVDQAQIEETNEVATEDHPEETKQHTRYSKGLETSQRMERKLTDANRKLLGALTAGLDTWIEERDKSAASKRDGAMRDGLKNGAKALRTFSRESAEVPADILDALLDERINKDLYRLNKRLSRLFRI